MNYLISLIFLLISLGANAQPRLLEILDANRGEKIFGSYQHYPLQCYFEVKLDDKYGYWVYYHRLSGRYIGWSSKRGFPSPSGYWEFDPKNNFFTYRDDLRSQNYKTHFLFAPTSLKVLEIRFEGLDDFCTLPQQ